MVFKAYEELDMLPHDDGDTVYLKLVEEGGGVKLVACDGSGDPLGAGNILRIRDDGVIHKFSNVNSSIVFATDERGVVLTVNE